MTDYSRELNKGMKVFSQLYVGLKNQSAGQPYLGFATPFEKGSAFEKRKETIRNWLGYRYPIIENGAYKLDAQGQHMYVEKELNTRIIDNTPRPGFKITDDVKRIYWGGGNVVWRICDPEGFELEIKSQNLMAVIQVAGINAGGEIPGKCLWGRSGKDNILLHEGSEEYKNAILAAETLKKPKEVGAANRVIGVEYLLQDGSTGTYLGKFWVATENDHESTHVGTTTIKTTHCTVKQFRSTINVPEQFDAILFGDKKNLEKCYIKFYKKGPLVRPVVNDTSSSMTHECAQEIANTCHSWSFAASSKNDLIVYVSLEKVAKFKYVASPVSRKYFEQHMTRFKSNISYIFAQNYTLDAGELHFFHDWHRKFGVKIDDDLFSGYCGAGARNHGYHNSPAVGALGEARIENGLNRYFSNRYGGGNHAVYEASKSQFKNWELPKFGNKDALFAWCESLFDEGRFVEFIVQPDLS